MFALTQEEGRKPGKWRDEDAYSWHHYDPLFKLHCLLVPVLATLFQLHQLDLISPILQMHKTKEIK